MGRMNLFPPILDDYHKNYHNALYANKIFYFFLFLLFSNVSFYVGGDPLEIHVGV